MPQHSTEQTIRAENAELRTRLEEAEQMLRDIRACEAEVLVVESEAGRRLMTLLDGRDGEQLRGRGEMIAQVSDAVIAVDLEQRITFLNAAAERLYGVQSGEMLGRKLTEIFARHWPSPEEEAAAWAALREHGEWHGQYLQHTHQGREVHVDSSFTALRDAHGAIIGYLNVIRDDTVRKQTEMALLEKAHFLQRVADVTPGVLHVFDLGERRYVFMNGSVTTLLGYSPEEVQAMDGEVVPSMMHAEDLPRFKQHMARVRALADGEVAHFEHRMRDRSGAWHWFLSHDAVFKRDAGGAVRLLIGVSSEITDRKHAEDAIREASEKALAANAAKDRFLAVLSHELRTPLTPVLMTVAALEHDPSLTPSVRNDVAMIRRNIEMETKLIDDLLDVSRIASGKLELRTEPLDLNEAVLHVCAICRPQLFAQEIALTLDLCKDAGFITADPARFEQVLWNVVKNAVKFTPQNGKIHVSSKRLSRTKVELRVADTGAGIAADILPRIFDAFEQGDPRITRQFGGLGLGLAISKALIELHGGSIRCESEGVGKGATFIIEVPGALAPLKLEPMKESTKLERNETPALRLLIVEDHVDTARSLKILLTQAGFTVTTAGSAAGALSLAKAETFDIVVSDLGLPDATGHELMMQIQHIQPLRGIAMSGYGMENDVRQSLAAGFSEHLVKPVKIPLLIATIQKVCDAAGKSTPVTPNP